MLFSALAEHLLGEPSLGGVAPRCYIPVRKSEIGKCQGFAFDVRVTTPAHYLFSALGG